MLPRLEAEEALKAANLSFATHGQVMEDMDRGKYLSDLSAQASPGKLASLEEIADAGISIVYEHGDKDASAPPEDADAQEVILPPGVQR